MSGSDPWAAFFLGEASIGLTNVPNLEFVVANPEQGWVSFRRPMTKDMFILTLKSVNPCPECTQGKHPNCDGTMWDNDKDELENCVCAQLDHQIFGA